ncbi:MAG: DUF86 domain-containing protein [Prevotellaceae bacterium]|jgi:uncharacterized protein with HEPN domain|nr:DUF86 domain-containing protein [Prevotellaceae bacterium]
MDNRRKKWLEDIIIAIDEVDIFFETLPKRYDTFADNLLLRRGIERNIEIIGEAMSRVLKAEPEISITNSRKIVDTRNYVIHGYDSLTTDILWSIVVNHLPVLKKEIETLLNE